jgi:putative protease
VKKPEILSPAGDIQSLKAAFAAGADAVYFGLPSFNARQRAKNIRGEDLPAIVSEAFLRGIKLYLTLNTLITEQEIPGVLEVIDTAMTAGIKGFIIQDLGVLYLLKKQYPEAEIHISTQATTHTKGQVYFLSKCGASRVNFARELDRDEITALTAVAHNLKMETEVFVHGSYCLSYSGQCYLCSFLEGTSGNRGLCQQNCRRLYRKNSNTGYFLNMKDNSALAHAQNLIASGVDSLKIEGRIKSPAYVYSAVKAWKKLVSDPDNIVKKQAAEELLDGVFNRGFTDGYLSDNVNSGMFADSPSDCSMRQFATVVSYTADSFTLSIDSRITSPLPAEIIIKENPDKFICSAIADEESEDPRAIRYAKTDQAGARAGFSYKIRITGKLDGKINRGDAVFAQRPALSAGEAEKSINNISFRKIPLTAGVSAEEGKPLRLKLESHGKKVLYESPGTLSFSRKAPAGRESFIKQLSRFGNTPFTLADTVFLKWDEDLFIPAKEVNLARRSCTAKLLGTIESARKDLFLKEYNNNTQSSDEFHKQKRETTLAVYLESLSAANELKSIYGNEITIMFEISDPDIKIDDSFIPVFPAVMDLEAENKYCDFIKNSRCNQIVLNSTALAGAADQAGKKWIAGNFLNITNSLALKQLSAISGCIEGIASLELSSQQAASLAEKSEIPVSMFIYSAVRLMTTRQCLLGYRCGKKTSDKNCFYCSCGDENLDEAKGRRLKICKKGWNYTELYDSSFISVPEIVPRFRGVVSKFIIDLRNFSFADHGEDKIPGITKAFKEYLENPDSARKTKINKLCTNISKGNIRKGL